VLQKDARSCFHLQIKFDSQGLYRLPITTLMAKGPSDLGSSLLGLARIGIDGGAPSQTIDTDRWLADRFIDIVKALEKDAPELLETGMLLAKPPEGTKGSATMLLGLGILLAYRTRMKGLETPEPVDVALLVKAAKNNLNAKADGKFSAQTKRMLLGEVAREYFADIKGEEVAKHEGIPVDLLRLFVTSAYACTPLPKEQRRQPTTPAKRGRKKKVEAESTITGGAGPDAIGTLDGLTESGTPVEVKTAGEVAKIAGENLSDPDHDLKVKSEKLYDSTTTLDTVDPAERLAPWEG
jgi:hypothetical protein